MKETKVTIPYCPRETAQLDLRNIHDSAARFRVVVAHRRLGKTTLANNELIRAACVKKGNYFYVAPTYRQAKLISWDIFKHYSIPQIVSKVNESELYIEFVNGSKILLKGADSPDCYDDKTQISTRTNGWKYFKDLTKDDEVLTLNPQTKKAEWQKPTEIITQDYSGEMVHFKNRRIDLLVTPNHKFYVEKRNKKGWVNHG